MVARGVFGVIRWHVDGAERVACIQHMQGANAGIFDAFRLTRRLERREKEDKDVGGKDGKVVTKMEIEAL